MAETKKQLQLRIVTADKLLFDEKVDAITAPTVEGEITVLPDHIPLMSKLQLGELLYQQNQSWRSLVISQGFINVDPENAVTVMVDAGTHERDLSIEKAQAAIEEANKTMTATEDQRELLLAEASLKRAMLELRVAQKSKKAQI